MHPPYVALYPSDFLADITTLGNTELGIYWRLLLVYYQTREPLPQDRDKLIRTAMAFSPEEVRALDYVIEQYFVAGTMGPDKVRVFRNERADIEIAAALERWNAAHDRAVTAANARWNAQAYARAKLEQCQPEPEPEPEPEPKTRTRRACGYSSLVAIETMGGIHTAPARQARADDAHGATAFNRKPKPTALAGKRPEGGARAIDRQRLDRAVPAGSQGQVQGPAWDGRVAAKSNSCRREKVK